MRNPHIDDYVRLTEDIPELSLNKGDVGVIRSTWFATAMTYEVEFHNIGHDFQTRCLVNAEQVVLEEGSIAADPAMLADTAGDYIAPD